MGSHVSSGMGQLSDDFSSRQRSCYLLISEDNVAKLGSFVLGPGEGECNPSFSLYILFSLNILSPFDMEQFKQYVIGKCNMALHSINCLITLIAKHREPDRFLFEFFVPSVIF